ncbi:MAG: tetratricopeptide repeat protein, partial [Planctomycetes bacterium]|nr:tetratricopeptide repeat protein [Planctomycetota bacterium]
MPAAKRRASDLIEAERAGQALALLAPLAAEHPTDAVLIALVAEAYYGLERFPEAIERFEHALRQAPALRGRV